MSNSSFCSACGSLIEPDCDFCTNCGGVPGEPPGQTRQQPSEPSASYSGSLGGQWSPGRQANAMAMPGAQAAHSHAPGQMKYAFWADRVLGAIIDHLLVIGVMVALYIFLFLFSAAGTALGGREAGGAIGASGCCLFFILPPLSQFVTGIFNNVYLVSRRGYSVGQGLMGLMVVNEQGVIVPLGTALVRLLARVGLMFIPIIGPFLDLLWPLWDSKRQTLHDKAVGTFVIKTR